MAEPPHSARQSKMTDRSFSAASEIVSLATDQTNASLKHFSKKVKSDKGVYKATSHSDEPSNTASIPSKYQTYFTSSNEPRGFNSCAARFNSNHDLVNDNPGPGTYRSSDSSRMSKTESFSTKGTGGLASRTKRFSKRRHTLDNVSPASYFPSKLSSRVDFNRSQVSRNFHPPYINTTSSLHGQQHLQGGPPPNAYNIDNNTNTNNSSGSSFKSTTKRSGVLTRANMDIPGPGQYSPNYASLLPTGCAHTSSFLSTTNRNFLRLKDGPGPADYIPNKKTKQLRPLYFRQKHYLCMSAPAIPLPPIPPPPGPGHYELTKQECPQLVSGAVFKSTSSRWGKPPDRDVPGPGSYDPRKVGKQSFFYNMNHQWV